MAEKVVRVCDICGDPAEQSVTFRVGARNLTQDLCRVHLQELVRHSHAPKRGRRPNTTGGPGRTPAAAGTRRAWSPRASRKAGTPKGRGKPVTDPAVLAKRQAALAKAREALARKRAAAKKAS
jgi:hypothetical protein